ncbi:hypothetical protein FRC12_000649 [Ceratobasidium sp. 428]|nr:hypothetical protein FRC12_000649 [Ceratobasidium sp. 428]
MPTTHGTHFLMEQLPSSAVNAPNNVLDVRGWNMYEAPRLFTAPHGSTSQVLSHPARYTDIVYAPWRRVGLVIGPGETDIRDSQEQLSIIFAKSIKSVRMCPGSPGLPERLNPDGFGPQIEHPLQITKGWSPLPYLAARAMLKLPLEL